MLKGVFKYIFTCQEDLIRLGGPFAHTISNTGPYIQDRMMYDKTKLISLIASNKGFLPGHKRRLEWVEKLKNIVHVYGRGRPNQLVRKEDGLRDYMFSVAIENDYSDSYFTQTLTDCFATGTIPIFAGSKKVIERYFDANRVIFLESVEQVKSLTPQFYY